MWGTCIGERRQRNRRWDARRILSFGGQESLRDPGLRQGKSRSQNKNCVSSEWRVSESKTWRRPSLLDRAQRREQALQEKRTLSDEKERRPREEARRFSIRRYVLVDARRKTLIRCVFPRERIYVKKREDFVRRSLWSVSCSASSYIPEFSFNTHSSSVPRGFILHFHTHGTHLFIYTCTSSFLGSYSHPYVCTYVSITRPSSEEMN